MGSSLFIEMGENLPIRAVLDLGNCNQEFECNGGSVRYNVVFIQNNGVDKKYYIERFEGIFLSHSYMYTYNIKNSAWSTGGGIPGVVIMESPTPTLKIGDIHYPLENIHNISSKINGYDITINVEYEMMGDVLVEEIVAKDPKIVRRKHMWSNNRLEWITFNQFKNDLNWFVTPTTSRRECYVSN